jgi:hypothetical protein
VGPGERSRTFELLFNLSSASSSSATWLVDLDRHETRGNTDQETDISRRLLAISVQSGHQYSDKPSGGDYLTVQTETGDAG